MVSLTCRRLPERPGVPERGGEEDGSWTMEGDGRRHGHIRRPG